MQVLVVADLMVLCTMGRINSCLLLLSNRRDFVVPKKCGLSVQPNASLHNTTQHNTTERGWITDWAELDTSTLPRQSEALSFFLDYPKIKG